MQALAIIVAGGTGTRFGGAIPKQFLLLHGKPMLYWSLRAFHLHDPKTRIILVLPEPHVSIWKTLCIGHGISMDHEVVVGGSERFHSVRAGVLMAKGEAIVAVHDGVRPLLSVELIERCFAAATQHGSAIPVRPITASIRQVEGDASRPIDRATLRSVQTPQCFTTATLQRAFQQEFDPAFTDEATLVERMGVTVHLVEGDEANIKVTTPQDLRVADILLDPDA